VRAPSQNALDTDAVLAARTQAGDRVAFGVLVMRHMRRGFAIAYRIMRHREDAEEVLQDAFVAALSGIQTFDADREFGPWFGRIVVRKALNAVEKRRRREREPLFADLADGRSAPDRDAARRQLSSRVRSALARMPPRQRQLIELVELEEYTAAEAAQLLGISAATARWHLHEARRRLRGILVESGFSEANST
jgi:RNA polymerase sigma-70 factor, ECF subfamily